MNAEELFLIAVEMEEAGLLELANGFLANAALVECEQKLARMEGGVL